MLVGQKWGVRRSVVLDQLREACGVDLLVPGTDDDLKRALIVLSQMRERGFRPETPPTSM